MKKLRAEDINLHIKMRFIGYYMSDEQFMRTEKIFPEQAEELANLMKRTYDTILSNRHLDDEMEKVFTGNTVFILKGEDGRLYGYYPKYNVARLTAAHYTKGVVTPMPAEYKRWFYPGNRFKLYNSQTNINKQSVDLFEKQK